MTSFSWLVAKKPTITVGARFYLLYVLFVLILFPVHELGHYVTYRLLGIHLQMTLNTASPANQALRKPIAEIAGPLVNLIVASTATIAFHLGGRRHHWLAALALAAAMARLVVYGLVVGGAVVTGSGLSLGNDEPIAAHLWGLPSLSLVAVLAVPLVFIVWSIVRTFETSTARKILHVVAFTVIMLCIGIFVGDVLDPWLFPNR